MVQKFFVIISIKNIFMPFNFSRRRKYDVHACLQKSYAYTLAIVVLLSHELVLIDVCCNLKGLLLSDHPTRNCLIYTSTVRVTVTKWHRICRMNWWNVCAQFLSCITYSMNTSSYTHLILFANSIDAFE